MRRFNSNTLKLEQCDVQVWLWDTLTTKIWVNKHDVFVNIRKPPAEFSFCNVRENAQKPAIVSAWAMARKDMV
jgi:hypothetical protein